MRQFLTILIFGVALAFNSSTSSQEKKAEVVSAKLRPDGRGFHSYLTNKYVLDALDLTDEQRRKIKEANDQYATQYLAVKQPAVESGVKTLPNGKTVIISNDETPQYKAFLQKRKDIRDRFHRSVPDLLLPSEKKTDADYHSKRSTR